MYIDFNILFQYSSLILYSFRFSSQLLLDWAFAWTSVYIKGMNVGFYGLGCGQLDSCLGWGLEVNCRPCP